MPRIEFRGPGNCLDKELDERGRRTDEEPAMEETARQVDFAMLGSKASLVNRGRGENRNREEEKRPSDEPLGGSSIQTGGRCRRFRGTHSDSFILGEELRFRYLMGD